MISRGKEQIGGLLIFLLASWLTWFIWNSALNGEYFSLTVAGAAPASAFVGLALLLFPSYKLERQRKGENLTQIQGHKLITPRWWVILVIALVIGFANMYFIQQ